jgi:3-deoxy-manno-octulosonate cytidylyltransferase (CMP-KDO synthetase)
MKTLGIIPARFASTRFPGKPMVLIHGKTMIQRVYEQAQLSDLKQVVIATDDKVIYNHAQSFGANVIMTSPHHRSGTDRIAEVANQIEADIMVNIQGDEPFIDPRQINALTQFLIDNDSLQIATLCKQITDNEQLVSPNIVKVVRSLSSKALYFSRNPIPFLRDVTTENWLSQQAHFKHIGMYAFRKNALMNIAKLEATDLEKYENLEQLRWLEHDFAIGVLETDIETIGIDTPEDLEKIKYQF